MSFASVVLRDGKRSTWRRAEAAVRALRGRVLLAEGLVPPEGFVFEPPDDFRYSQLLMKNGLELLLAAASREAASRTALLVDWSCRRQAFADVLVRYFLCVHIVTHHTEAYRNYLNAKLSEWGAAVVVTDVVRPRSPVSLIVSPDGLLPPQLQDSAAPILLPRAPVPGAVAAVHSFRAELLPALAELLPPGVDPYRFQAALCTCCGMSRLASLPPARACFGGIWRELPPKGKINIFSLDIKNETLYN